MDLKIIFKIDVNKNKDIVLKLVSLEINHEFKQLEIKANFLLRYFANHISIFKNLINWILHKILKSKIKSLIRQLDENLQKSIKIPLLGSEVKIDMPNTPKFKENYFEIDLEYEFKGQKVSTFLHDDKEETLKDKIEISINANLLNNLITPIIKKKSQYNITTDNIPSNIPFKINTNYFRNFYPEMYNKYPNKDLVIGIIFNSTPFFSLNHESQSTQANLKISLAFALKEDPNVQFLVFETSMIISLGVNPNLEDKTLHIKILKVFLGELEIKKDIGSLDAGELKKQANDLFKSLSYFANNYLRVNPIALPVISGLKFKSLNLKVEEDNSFSVSIMPDIENSEFNWLFK